MKRTTNVYPAEVSDLGLEILDHAVFAEDMSTASDAQSIRRAHWYESLCGGLRRTESTLFHAGTQLNSLQTDETLQCWLRHPYRARKRA